MQEEENHYGRSGRQELPYQARVRRNRPQGEEPFNQTRAEYYERNGQQPGQNPPGMLAFEEKVNQFAEGEFRARAWVDVTVGKQTFNSLFNKAKAKYTEFQSQHNANMNQPDRARETHWGEGNQPWRQPSPANTPGGGRGGDQNSRGTYRDDTS